ncbi:LCP family protein [Ureibacillus thermophilus]|uniref:Regulatory protein MsrR n=1 Tax=Ureibacillus thermophilus TaxID=367743 RepID=A0A4P6UUY5_9BACL|nr:LCP family protein [Ureibacillus thermophilus]QBK26031.1 LytR family transcriptional regulator [Ureibacillus thermophilus]
MEEHEIRSRKEKRIKKKRLRIGRLIVALFLLMIIGVIAYSVHQYRMGLELAGDVEKEEVDFLPDEDNEGFVNYLIIGVDSRGEEKSRSDTMMLLSWNKETNDVKLVSFMRDIYANIPGYDSWKLNTAYYLGGVQLLKKTLNEMFDIPIHHYVVMDFKSFESLIDLIAPNGVEIEVEKDMSAYIGVTLKKGVHRLNGKELLGYARFRHDEQGDFGRVERQQKVIEALKDEVLRPANIKNLPKLIGAAQGYIQTDMTSGEEIKTVFSVLKGGVPDLQKMTIPVEGTYRFNSYQHAGSVIEIDLEANKRKLHEFLGY